MQIPATYQWCFSLHLMQQHSVSTAPPSLWLLPAGRPNTCMQCYTLKIQRERTQRKKIVWKNIMNYISKSLVHFVTKSHHVSFPTVNTIWTGCNYRGDRKCFFKSCREDICVLAIWSLQPPKTNTRCTVHEAQSICRRYFQASCGQPLHCISDIWMFV